MVWLVVLVAAAVFGWGLLAARLQHLNLTGPMVFVAVGLAVSTLLPPDHTPDTHALTLLAEVTLAWVLFSDAARVGLPGLRADAALESRLLGVGLPLTIALGTLLAGLLVPGVDLWLALFVGAALAPTDAALGGVLFANRTVPARLRRLLNVESGLNDGIATPFVLVALAAASAERQHGGGIGAAVIELAVGVGVGVAAGLSGGVLLRAARRRDWVDESYAGQAVLALALIGYACAVGVGGNGFVAAFVGGLAFGNVRGPAAEHEVRYVDHTAGLASLLVWMLFGAVAVPRVLEHVSWSVLLYVALSLTVVRMLPVATVLLGSGLGRRTVLVVGWFGPRGLASVVFALLAVDQLGAAGEVAIGVVVTGVLISVVAHGLTARHLASILAEDATVDAVVATGKNSRRDDDPPAPGRLRHPAH